MSTGLYSGASGLALGTGLNRGTLGLYSGAAGLARGGGTPTPSVGNLILASNWADFLTKYAAAAPGDVVSINHGGYTPTTPQVFAPNHPVSGAGATFIGASNQIIQLKIDGQVNLRNEFVNWYCDIDSVNGNETADVASVASSAYCRNSDSFAIRGCVFTRGMWGIYNYNNSNFVEENNLCQFQRADAMRLDVNPAQFQIKGNYFGDVATNGKMWWYTDGTTPVFNIDPGSGTFYDKEHNDGIQAFLGSMTDAEISGNDFYIQGQVCFIADNVGNPQLRVKFTGNNLRGADPYQLLFDNGSHVEVTGNAFSAMPVMSPGISDVKITIAGSNIKYGQNTVAAGGYGVSVTYVGVTQANFVSGSITGTATAPTAPTWTGTTSNVGNLAALRLRKTPATAPSPAIPVGLPVLLSSGANTVGVKVTARPPLWNPYTPGMEDNLYSRFKLDGTIVRASTQGRAAMVYTTLAAGALTVQFSSDNVNWSTASAAMTIAAAGTTLNPSDMAADITLSNGNLTATRGAAADGHRLVRSIGKIEQTDGDYAFNFTPTTVSGATQILALCNAAWSLTADPSDFGAGKALGMYSDGNTYWSGNSTNFGITDAPNGSNSYTMVIRRSGSGSTVLAFLRGPSGWYSGGDPYASGAGKDISQPFANQDIYVSPWLWRNGAACTFDFASPFSPPSGGSPSDV